MGARLIPSPFLLISPLQKIRRRNKVFSLSAVALVLYIIRTKVDKLNVKTETWTPMPPLKEGRLNHDCAFHRSTDARKSYVVVAGGSDG